MWRDDDLYDIVVVLGHNDDPPVPGSGSAIFMHVARPGFAPTEGCVALALPDLVSFLTAHACLSGPFASWPNEASASFFLVLTKSEKRADGDFLGRSIHLF